MKTNQAAKEDKPPDCSCKLGKAFYRLVCGLPNHRSDVRLLPA